MPKYEHVFLARQDVSQQQVDTLTQEYKTLITEAGGNVGRVEYWGLKNLAYKIKTLTESDSVVEFLPYDKAFAKGSYEDLNYRIPDLEKIREHVGYEPKVTLDTTLRKMIEHYES